MASTQATSSADKTFTCAHCGTDLKGEAFCEAPSFHEGKPVCEQCWQDESDSRGPHESTCFHCGAELYQLFSNSCPHCFPKQSAHTPGPWHVGLNGLDIREADETPIVSLPTSEYQTRERQEANARLIAAAPELLEAAKQALWKLRTLEGQNVSPTRDSLLEAITEAEGN